MKVVICATTDSACEYGAKVIADTVKKNPAAVLGLATGGTMERLYEKFVVLSSAQKLQLTNLTSFNLDELIGVTADDPRSYHRYMQHHLFSKLAFNPLLTHLPLGDASDPEAEARRYEALIAANGGIDLQLLGLGLNGHIGFNEPLSSFQSTVRVAPLAAETIKSNAQYCGGEDKVPTHAITLGIKNILESKRSILLVTGAAKAEVLAQVIEGPLTAMIPATALHLHSDCTVIVDEAAAAKLCQRSRYQHTIVGA